MTDANEMLVIDGKRYRPEDARALGLTIPTPDVDVAALAEQAEREQAEQDAADEAAAAEQDAEEPDEEPETPAKRRTSRSRK